MCDEFVVVTMETLSYDDKYGGKTELEVLTVLQPSFDEEIDIESKIPKLYDSLVDSSIVFSGITGNLLESLLKTHAKAYGERLLSQEA